MKENTPRLLVQEFAQKHKEKTGNPYFPNWGRDCKIFKLLLDHPELSEGRIKEMIFVFFNAKFQVLTIPYFYSVLNDLFWTVSDKRSSKKLSNPDRERYD